MEKLGTDYGGWYVPTNLNLDEKKYCVQWWSRRRYII